MSEPAYPAEVVPAADAELPVLPEEAPGGPQRRGFLALFVAAWFGVTLVAGAAGVAVPKLFAFLDDASKSTNLSIVVAIGGVVVIVVTPLFGRLSDRTRSRLGIRRPWIVGGALVGLVGLVVLAVAHDLWTVVVGYCIAQIGYGATNMALHALLADQIPTRIRARVAGTASALGGLAGIVAVIFIAALPNDAQALWFLVPGLVSTALSIALFAGLKDIVRPERQPPVGWGAVLATYWINPIKYPDFFWAFITRMFVTIGLFTVSVYLLYFIIDRLGIPKEEASGIQAVALVLYTAGAIVTNIPAGWLSDRLGRRKPTVWVACLLSALGLVIMIFSQDLTLFYIGFTITGLAQGAFVSVDIALMTEVLPTFKDAGKDLGIVALSYQLPQFIVPVLAVPLLAIGGGENYTALYIAAIVITAVGGLATLPIRKVR